MGRAGGARAPTAMGHDGRVAVAPDAAHCAGAPKRYRRATPEVYG